MQLTRDDNAVDFLARAGDFLAAREAEHNLILGLSSRLRHQPLMYGEPAYFASVEDDHGEGHTAVDATGKGFTQLFVAVPAKS